MRGLHDAGRLGVLSYGEGRPLSLAPILPRVVVVPKDSAYPGYGDFVVLEDHDHIATCKPATRSEAPYARTLAFLEARFESLGIDRQAL